MSEYQVFLINIAATTLVVAFLIFCCQLVVERFLTKTLPVIMELYGRIRYPEVFSKVDPL